MKGLVLHCGGQVKSRADVFAVPLPEATSTYHPLPYESFVTRIEKQLSVEGIRIKEEQLALSNGGQRLFGLMAIELPALSQQEYGCVLGLRTSYDKSLASGLCVGASVFVCDNLSFKGEITFARKHTANMLRDLSWLLTDTIATLPTKFAAQAATFEAYKHRELTDRQAHDLMIQFYDSKAISVTEIPHLLKEWREPRHAAFEQEKNGWRLFNAATETIKGDLWRLPQRTRLIHEILDREFAVAGTPPSEQASHTEMIEVSE